jgi:hypothetical protein
MGFLAALALMAAIAGATWVLRRSGRKALPLPPDPKSLPFPSWEPVGVPDLGTPPIEKTVAGQLGFLDDLKRREREVDPREQGRRPDPRHDDVIDAEFHELTDRDRQA